MPSGGPAGDSRSSRRAAPSRIDIGDDVFRVGDVDIADAAAALAMFGAEGRTSLGTLSATETIALLTQLRNLSGAVAAVQARALVHLEEKVKEDCRRREETPKEALKIARAEAATALKQSSSCAGQTMSSCRRLVHSMPGMLGALAHGRILPVTAHKVGRTMSPASPEQRAQVDEILTAHLPYLEDCGPEEWAGEAEKVLHGLDPHGAADRHRAAKKDRSVTVRRGQHGMCTLTANLPALEGARIRKGLSVAAEKAKAHGDRRGHQQIMADLLADALLGRSDGIDPSTMEIGIIITDRSLLAPDHADAATIEGYGAVPYEHVREEMLAAVRSADDDPELAMTLRKLYTDLDDGQIVAVESTARRFPPALARFLRIAHQTCRAPNCDASIRQNDHIVPWSKGGPTSVDNGNGLCLGDNQKEESGQRARVIRDEHGNRRTVEWTTRYGQTAQRRGINYDPLGTGARLIERAAETSSSARSADADPSEDGTVHAEEPGIDPSTRERGRPLEGAQAVSGGESQTVPGDEPQAAAGDEIHAASGDEPHGSLGRALRLIDTDPPSRSSWEERHRLEHRRKDHVFFPHLTLITDRPWRGPEADAA